MTQGRVGNANDGGFPQYAALEKHFFYLVRTDAKPRGFEHIVASSDKVEKPLFVHGDEIAGITNSFAVAQLPRQKGVRLQDTGGQFRLAPVAHRDRGAPMNQLPCLSR